jgi:hypothetical protein
LQCSIPYGGESKRYKIYKKFNFFIRPFFVYLSNFLTVKRTDRKEKAIVRSREIKRMQKLLKEPETRFDGANMLEFLMTIKKNYMKTNNSITQLLALTALLIFVCHTPAKAQSSLPATKPQSAALRFNSDSAFKIAQFTDIHYVTSNAESRKSLLLMEQVIREEKPDFIMFTGDIVTCSPQKQGWDEVLSIPIAQGIPYAVTLGNHDDEHDWTRSQIMEYISAKPYCLSQKGPDGMKGYGNFILEVQSRQGETAALLYCLDSNAYDSIATQKGYAWFGVDQIAWYSKRSKEYTQAHRGAPYPALAFFHIPLQEYTLLADTTKNYVVQAPLFGRHDEKECPGILNTGMFAAMVEAGDVMGVFVGHDHDNNYIGYLNGVCLAYGQCSGISTAYGHIGKGSRIIKLKENQRSFDSWIRTEDNQTIFPVTYPQSF